MQILCITSQRASLTNVRPEAEIFIGLQRAGCSVTVMTEGDSDYTPLMRAAGIDVVDFSPERKLSLRAIRQIRAQLTGKDIAWAFNNKAIANLVWAARGLPVKVVTYRGQSGNISRFDPTAYLTHLHPRVDAIVCVADAVRKSLAPQLRDPTRAVTVYKGHDLAWYADVRPMNLGPLGIGVDDTVVLCVSNYRPRKGLETLILAFAGLERPAHLVLAGTGTDSVELAACARAAGIAADRFHGLGYQHEVLPLTAAADIAVLPALKREGLPKTVIEAMALGLAVVVSDTGGNAELVEHSRSGLVVEPGDSAALRQALRQLCDDPVQRVAFGEAARERIRHRFNTGTTVRETLAVFQRLLA